ncbi:MAG: aldo/keto reductase, partial [Anaerolineae bacterium]|nr:aldo/keto reductase [Anaerolineae bacterium]
MQYRTLGSRSSLKVSEMILFTMMFGDQTDEAEAGRIVADARERGVNFIDTADVYSRGGSERLLGRLIRDSRAHWVLATKLGNRMDEGPNDQHYSRWHVLRACEASLQRLGTDHVDLYYLHRDV